ncbi:MAG: NAD(P)-dependent alcohol dehydrogenase [Tenericutes bacterium]|jgi:NADPH:quinone reductase-like Zn-dependent oxidoreductase|nr:NAD(P)-dependent alcohol dehydrogenase [Mycoplasmatota bacterium]
MKTSYCAKYGGPEVYQIIDIDTPEPKENEVLVKVYRAVVSPTDGNFRSGKPLIARLFSGLFKPKMKIHGEMFVGEIVEVGTDVKYFKVNDMVYGTNGMKLGAYAEYVAVNVKNAIKKVPKDLDYKDVLPLIDGGITALPFLKEVGHIKAGDSVLINGSSGAVGSMAVMIAKHFKAEVTGVCSTNNVEKVKSLGADHVIDYKNEDFIKNNNKYDIIFDAVGKSSYGKAKSALIETGIYITTVPTPGVMIQALLRKKAKNKRASFMAAGLRKPNVKIEDLNYLEELVRSGELKPLHGKVYKLEDLGKAQIYVETGHKVGNVTIKVFE